MFGTFAVDIQLSSNFTGDQGLYPGKISKRFLILGPNSEDRPLIVMAITLLVCAHFDYIMLMMYCICLILSAEV
jgi:hypothetical protein